MADIAGFFKKLGDKVEDMANKTAKTAGDLTQKGKYKVEINKYRTEIKNVQTKLGRDVIEAKLAGHGNEAVLELVDGAFAKIEELKAEIKRVEVLFAEVGMEAGEKFEDFADDLADELEEKTEDAADFAADLGDELKDKAEDVATAAEDLGEELKDTAQDAAEAVEGKVEDVKESIEDKLN